MSQQIDTSRRRALRFLAGAGLLPMASSLARASTMSLAPDGVVRLRRLRWSSIR